MKITERKDYMKLQKYQKKVGEEIWRVSELLFKFLFY